MNFFQSVNWLIPYTPVLFLFPVSSMHICQKMCFLHIPDKCRQWFTRKISLSRNSSFLLGTNLNNVWSTHKVCVLPVADERLFFPVKETYVLVNLLEEFQYIWTILNFDIAWSTVLLWTAQTSRHSLIQQWLCQEVVTVWESVYFWPTTKSLCSCIKRGSWVTNTIWDLRIG